MRILPSQSSGMKRKVGSTRVVHDRQVEPVALGDRRPVGDARRRRAGPRRGAGRCRGSRRGRRRAGRSSTYGRDVVVRRVRRRRAALERHAPHAGEAGRRAARWRAPRSSAVTSVSAGPPCGGLYLKPPSSGGLCDGVTTMPSASPRRAPAVVGEDRVRDDRRRRAAVVARRPSRRRRAPPAPRATVRERRLRQRVGVPAEEQRPVDALRRAVAADRLR